MVSRDDARDLVGRSRSPERSEDYCLHISLLVERYTVKVMITFMTFVEQDAYRSANLENVGTSLDALTCIFVTELRQMCEVLDPPCFC